MVLVAIWHGGDEDALTKLVQDVKVSGELPPGCSAAKCKHAPLIARMVAHAPGKRPSSEECLQLFIGGGAFARRLSQVVKAVMDRERAYLGALDGGTLRESRADGYFQGAGPRRVGNVGSGSSGDRKSGVTPSRAQSWVCCVQ
mmetsp:Transcript_43071/g.106290  ORF Transcript_43071/g.106290 Transcript_43071/m.106290 type:complete len:143 (-) Transcript_43071:125-553(-)